MVLIYGSSSIMHSHHGFTQSESQQCEHCIQCLTVGKMHVIWKIYSCIVTLWISTHLSSEFSHKHVINAIFWESNSKVFPYYSGFPLIEGWLPSRMASHIELWRSNSSPLSNVTKWIEYPLQITSKIPELRTFKNHVGARRQYVN